MPDDLDAALDRLYGLPAEEFTAARDALAKELRGAKRRDEAAAVKQRRRPTAPAAAINQLARREPELVEDLIRAAGDLVGVQERVLGGDAGRDELRAAADAERRAVGALLAAAATLTEKPSAAVLEKVRDTLHAAATDDTVREAIAGGRLEREAEPAGAWGGGFPLGGIGAPPTTEEATSRGATTKKTTPRAAAARGAAKEAAEEDEEAVVSTSERVAERRARKRAEALERARAEDADAQRELTEAQAAAAEAHELLEAAVQRAEAARAAVVEAEAAEDEARSEAQRTLRALKRAEAVAADTEEKVARLDRG
jgi:hypothetical protein